MSEERVSDEDVAEVLRLANEPGALDDVNSPAYEALCDRGPGLLTRAVREVVTLRTQVEQLTKARDAWALLAHARDRIASALDDGDVPVLPLVNMAGQARNALVALGIDPDAEPGG